MPTVTCKATGHLREVKNLTWLLRNARKVTSIELRADKPREGYPSLGCLLVAQLYQRDIPTLEYRCECSSLKVMKVWIERPSLRHAIKCYT
jgi:hypothetical protein